MRLPLLNDVARVLALGAIALAATSCTSTVVKKITKDVGQFEQDGEELPIEDTGSPSGADGSNPGTKDADTQGKDGKSDVDVFVADIASTDIGGKAECESTGAWGCPCQSNSDCLAEFCVTGDKGKVCSEKCFDDSSCPQGWGCTQVSGLGPDLVYVCVPRFTNICRPCTKNEDCGAGAAGGTGNVCLSKDDGKKHYGSFCGTKCATTKDCPAGYECANVPGGTSGTVTQCIPAGGADCSCTPLFVIEGDSTPCWKENEFGKCTGTRKCTDKGLTKCSALEPEPEVCDDDDNNCNGKTDEVGAVGCVSYFQDNDGDSFGIGKGVCQCKPPGEEFATEGGDCNDLATNVNPNAAEVCNQIDDNCNGETDEPGSGGCSIFYHDKDKDTFGDPNDSACLCPPQPAEWIEQAGDCDDASFDIHPGSPELCNAKDDNCNGKTDDENAEGCELFYADGDGDGYGPTQSGKCMCKADAVYKVTKAGDCDDTASDVHPFAPEVCNGVDDDCNNKTDDGAASTSCPVVANGTAACTTGKCMVGMCVPSWFDVNTQVGDGCECQADQDELKGGQTCEAAVDWGTLSDGGSTITVSGNVVPGDDSDWVKFVGKDVDDISQGGCDKFHVRARFLFNPGDQFVLDLYRGNCAGAAQLCKGEVDVGWRTNYFGAPDGPATAKANPEGDVVKTPNPAPAGECPCTNSPGAPNVNFCSDNTAVFYVRIYRKAGVAPTCDSYTAEITNGVY